MLKENNEVRKLTNVDSWHNRGHTGKGIHVVIFDEKGSPHKHMEYANAPFCKETKISHATNVAQVIHEFAPDSKVTMLYGNEKCREYFKEIANTVDLVNISMSANEELAEYSWGFLNDYDIPVVCSSGNQYKDEVAYPAKFDWTIAVGAYNGSVKPYSNGGQKLDCVGLTNIKVMNSEKRVFNFNGTSASAPVVTGMLACYAQYKGKLTRNEAFQFIHENCRDILKEGFDLTSGHGLFILPSIIKKQEVIDKMAQYFKDISEEHWAHDEISRNKERGITKGFADGTLKPSENLTRAQENVMIDRAINFILEEVDQKLIKLKIEMLEEFKK